MRDSIPSPRAHTVRRVKTSGFDLPFTRERMRSALTGSVPTSDDPHMDSRDRKSFDVLVIGGGVTGLGAAVDAASRGLRTALIERNDFASGTSSKSSKLVHGGLRYLQQGDVRLVYEALRERQRLRRNARHLVDVLPFMIPILTKDGLISRKIARALGSALWMYDFTGGVRIGRIHRRLKKTRALSHLPTMVPDRLASAYVYYDARADDARLCLALARTAVDLGATVLNHARVTDIARVDDRFLVTVHDTAGSFTVSARTVVNAAGVWVDEVLSSVRTSPGSHDDAASSTGTRRIGIRPAKGVHITVPWDKVRNDIAVVIPVPKDRRSLFLVPWGPQPDGTFTHTYVGTTDTDHAGSLDDPTCTKDDIDYVLRALDNALTTTLTSDDVIGTWAGLRPLVEPSNSDVPNAKARRTTDLSRRHHVSVDAEAIVTITGGKLTTYREMAEDAVDALMPMLDVSVGPLRRHRSRTKRLALHGSGRRRNLEVAPSLANHLWSRYGTDARHVIEFMNSDARLAEPLVPGLPYVRAEVVHAVRHEMACSLDDVLSRRTRALLFDRAGARAAAPLTAQLMAPLLGWSQAEIDSQIRAFDEICEHEVVSASLTELEAKM